jgi:uncharacterized membrane protein YedE/YeeE
MYDAVFVHPWPWWVAGPLIGLYAVLFFAWPKRNLGASSGYPAVLEALRGTDDPARVDLTRPDDPLALPMRPRDAAPRWRVWWMAGLLLAGALVWALGGEAAGLADLPGFKDSYPGLPLLGRLGVLFGGGLLVGFGARMSGGCTSGHAIFGISQRQLPSLWATLTFFAVGMATAFAIHWSLGGA